MQPLGRGASAAKGARARAEIAEEPPRSLSRFRRLSSLFTVAWSAGGLCPTALDKRGTFQRGALPAGDGA